MSDKENFDAWFLEQVLCGKLYYADHDISEYVWNERAALAQPSGVAQEGRITELEGAVSLAIGCLDAAESEGFSGEINSSELQSTLAGQRIYDIYHRRIIFAIDALKGVNHG